MGMKYVGAYLLAVLGGNDNPSKEEVEAILQAGGIEVDQAILGTVMQKVEGKSPVEIMSSGYGKLEKVGGGGGGGCGGGVPAATAAAGGDAGGGAKKEEKKVEEEEEEEDFIEVEPARTKAAGGKAQMQPQKQSQMQPPKGRGKHGMQNDQNWAPSTRSAKKKEQHEEEDWGQPVRAKARQQAQDDWWQQPAKSSRGRQQDSHKDDWWEQSAAQAPSARGKPPTRQAAPSWEPNAKPRETKGRHFVEEEQHETEEDYEEELWVAAKAVAFRGPKGCMVRLIEGDKENAWLPVENIKPLIASKGMEAAEAIKKAVKVKGLQVRIVDRNGEQPTVTMWSMEEEEDWEKTEAKELEGQHEKELRELRENFDPNEWRQGTVSAVKNYGVFVTVLKGQDVLVPVSHIPEGSLTFEGGTDQLVPDLERGQAVAVRILGYQGKDANGRDRYRCSMLPPDPQEEKPQEESEDKDKGYDYDFDPPGRGRSTASRQLENAHTLAMQEGTEIKLMKENQMKPRSLAARYAAKGFAVCDDETAGMLQTVISPKVAQPTKSALKRLAQTSRADVKKQIQVWIVAGVKQKAVGFIPVTAAMTDADKEQLARELAIKEDPGSTFNGTSIKEIVVSDKKIEIRVPGSRV
eukprot:gnl/MRDRNA2_/MRDRNA2_87645_c0_seq1.p1 gnl/MRDRNA2_/MRDRNA2_87645_c0~~gnl/MRDRNA2_/MRDRNA2_87645_c0_seq1.p1  ORF type:complete len:633 (+),score=188.09 gnl/MRDRNA2_/MRDRNA2_87645_c0_seq1:81-1979(+)